MTNPRTEAQTLFSEVVANLTSSSRDLMASLRKCLLACELVGWKSQSDWFKMELEGYPAEVAKPYYRIIKGVLSWQPTGNPVDTVFWQSSDEAYSAEISSESINLDVFARLDWIQSAAQNCYTERTDEEKTVRYRDGRRTITLRRQKYFAPPAFGSILVALENKVYMFAVSSYIQLKYCDLQASIWEDYSKRAEQALLSMNLSQHLD